MTGRQETVNATAGQAEGRSLADRFGIEPGMVVMEMGYDDDVDEDLRDALIDRCGELVDEDTDEVVDVVLLWWRDGDGDLVDTLVDAGYVGVARRVAAVDSFIPLGPAARHVLVSEDQIMQGVRSLLMR